MRPHLTIFAVAMAAIACHESSTAPPTGLPVTLSYLSTPTPPTAVTGAGDSAVVSIPFEALASVVPPDCGSRSVHAGIENGALIVTDVEEPPDPKIFGLCDPVPISFFSTVRVVVNQVPLGTYTVTLVVRVDRGAPLFTEQTLASGSITLP